MVAVIHGLADSCKAVGGHGFIGRRSVAVNGDFGTASPRIAVSPTSARYSVARTKVSLAVVVWS
jgi:hypothetical protein